MAIDSSVKRKSPWGIPTLFHPPIPDGLIELDDLQNIAWNYPIGVIIEPVPISFGREPAIVVALTVPGTVAGSQTFYFSIKEGRALSIIMGLDVRPYIMSFRGRATRIQPDKALTERGRMTLNFADDPDAPAFDPAVFSITTGGSFWRRLKTAQPDLHGAAVEIKRGFVSSTMTFPNMTTIFKGTLHDLNFGSDQTAALTFRDRLALEDIQIPSAISDSNVLTAGILATDTAIPITTPDELLDPADLDSKDYFPQTIRIDPDGTSEDVIINSISGNDLLVQGNYLDKSEELDNAAWTATGATVLPDVSRGPFGGEAHADAITFSGTGDKVEQTSAATASADSWSFSIWLRNAASAAAETALVSLEVFGGVGLVTQQVTIKKSGWTRFEAVGTITSGSVGARIVRKAGDDATDILAFGAQLEQAAARGYYVATDGNEGADAGRGAYGSSAAAHNLDDPFLEILPFRSQLADEGVHPVVVLRDFVNRGKIDVADVDQDTFDQEFDFIENIAVRRSGNTLIDESEKLSEYMATLRQESLLDTWISETGLVRCRLSFRQNLPGVNVKTISDEDNIVQGSSNYKGNSESRTTRVLVYYNLQAGKDGGRPSDYSNVHVTVDLGVEAISGEKAKRILSKWIYRSPEAIALAGRTVSRFRRGARIGSWNLDPADEDDFFLGDVIALDSQEILVPAGGSAGRKATQWQVVQKTNDTFGGIIGLEGLEFSGRRYGIISPDDDLESAPDPFPDYPAASEAERQYGFIGDANNLVDVGTIDGYYIL